MHGNCYRRYPDFVFRHWGYSLSRKSDRHGSNCVHAGYIVKYILPGQSWQRRGQQPTILKDDEQIITNLPDAFWHRARPGYFKFARSRMPGCAAIVRFFDSPHCADSLGRAKNDVRRVIRIEPYAPTITIVQQYPGCATVI